MSNKDKDDIKRSKKDVKISEGQPKFKKILTSFVKKASPKTDTKNKN